MKTMKMTLIVLLAISSIFISQNVFAYQFENFKWGQSLAEVKEGLRGKNAKEINNNSDIGLFYSDKILSTDCYIALVFSPKSKLLASIMITWKTTSIGNDLKKMLIKKYGIPSRPNHFMDKYYWGEGHNSLLLNYTFSETKLIYFGGLFAKRWNEESQNIIEQEIDKF